MQKPDRRNLEILFEKCASLIFAIEGISQGPAGGPTRRPVGSGMFVAPCQALTAKHVMTDMHNVTPDSADYLRRQVKPYVSLPYLGSAAQIVDIKVPDRSAEWGLTNVWPNPLSDIALLQLAPVDEDAKEMMSRMRPLFPEWSLLPPPIGETVALLGQPRESAPSAASDLDKLTYQCIPAVVTANFEKRHDRGMYSFPCFTVDREVPHGMSGGPVFWDGRFCGVVSGGLGAETVVASLWPVCLTDFGNPKLGELDQPVTFQSLFDSGQLKAVDWSCVKGRVSYGMENNQPVALLRSPESSAAIDSDQSGP